MTESRSSVLASCATLEEEIEGMMERRDNLYAVAGGIYPKPLRSAAKRRADEINRDVCNAQQTLWTMMFEQGILPMELECGHPDLWTFEGADYCEACGDAVAR